MSDLPKLPSSWAEVTIDVVLQPLLDGRLLHHGWSPQCEAEPSTSDNEWGVLKTTAVQDGLYLAEHNKRLPTTLAPRSHLEIEPGDILITCAGPRNRCGVPCLVRHTRRKLILSGKMYRFRVNEAAMDAAFLEGYLRAKDTQQAIDRMKTGISDSGLNLTHGRFFRLNVPVAPLPEQKRIVTKIEELFSDLDAGVAALKRAKANLKRYRAAVLKAAVEGKLTQQWRAEHPETEPASKLLERILTERRKKWEADQLVKFSAADKEPPKGWRDKYVEPKAPDTTGLPDPPDGWCWATVEQTNDVQGGIQKQPKRSPGENSFPFLRVANVHRNRLDLDEIHQIELFGEELERLRLQPDDLLVVEGNGSKTEIGRSAIWKGEIKNCVHQNHIIRVRFKAGSSRYLNAYWNSPSGNGRVMEQAASTSGLYTLSVTKVCALPIPLAPLTEQQQIVAEVEHRLSVIAAVETGINHDLLRAARLRQSILKQAFEGKLVPQDPKDEPASVVLKRIRATVQPQNENRHRTNN